jgi:hypothetical protein
MLSDFTVVANSVAGTSKKGEEERFLADYLSCLGETASQRSPKRPRNLATS